MTHIRLVEPIGYKNSACDHLSRSSDSPVANPCECAGCFTIASCSKIIGAEEFLAREELDPLDNDLKSFLPDREEPSGEALRELCLHLPRILDDLPFRDVDVLEFQRYDRPVTSAGEQCEGDECPVAPINLFRAGHCAYHTKDLRNCGDPLLRHGLGYPRILFR